ncbi:hypothetical protein G5714_000005 [Onychostoma macrolepis]|uniref:Uncharacterized protein n=1 Tax=Onychostoma macrolepis TaxID=369639 RepID=A0A7J6DGP0_9TELE|nr:hypothetical protein G5714_000005 [Onychostoma macrolepis]
MENRERSSSPDHSCVSLKSDRSMGPPPYFSDDPVTSDPRVDTDDQTGDLDSYQPSSNQRQQEAGHGLFELFFSGRGRHPGEWRHHAKDIFAVKIMEQLWIESIRRKLRIEKDSRVSTDIKIVHGDKKTEFMENYVEELQKKTKTFFLAAVHRWFTSRDGGNLSPDKRHVIIHAMTRMKACITEEDFVTVSTSVCNDLDAQLGSNRVTTYLKVHWLPHAALWANFWTVVNSSDTNNKAERFFLALKCQFLRGEANRRVDQLLHLLCGDIQKYYCYLDDFADAGRLRVSSSASTSTAAKSTVGQQILINEQGKCSVQTGAGPNSDSTLNTVDLVKMQCDCGLYDKGNVL